MLISVRFFFGAVVLVLVVFFTAVLASCMISSITADKTAIASNFDNVTDFGFGSPFDDHRSFLSDGVRYYYEPNKTIDGTDVLNILTSDDSDDVIMTINTDTDKIIWKKK